MSSKPCSEMAKRRSAVPTVPLLAGARSAGRYVADRALPHKVRRANFLELFWVVKGELHLSHPNRQLNLQKNQAAFLFPGEIHDYQLLQENTEFYWVTWDGSYLQELRAAYQLPDTVIEVGECPIALFDQLSEEINQVEAVAEYHAALTALAILHLALSRERQLALRGSLVERFKQLVALNYADPECSVSSLARELEVHRATLHKSLQAAGISAVDYITNLRLQRAQQLLDEGVENIATIARACGYANSNYFSKVIRKKWGGSPRHLN